MAGKAVFDNVGTFTAGTFFYLCLGKHGLERGFVSLVATKLSFWPCLLFLMALPSIDTFQQLPITVINYCNKHL
jgi:hypothetical protein